MNDELTLNHFFSFVKELPQGKMAGIESGEKLSAVKERISRDLKASWPAISRHLEENIAPLLDIGLPDIFTGAVKKYVGLLKYLDREKYPPNESYLVSLLEHTVSSVHHPYIEIIINDNFKKKIDFTITISLLLEGMILKIQDGKILEIFPGSCEGAGTVECEDFVILDRKSGPFKLPGSIKLGTGIPIA